MNKKKIIILVCAILVITNILTAVLVGLGFNYVGLIPGMFINTKGLSFEEIYKYNNVKKLIQTRYIENVDNNILMEGSIKGLAESVNDPYTIYMDKKEFESLQIHTKASYAGIGIVVGIDPKDNLIMVSEVIENSPAEKAKILAGDKIIKVEDTEVTGDNFEKAVDMIRGEKGTQVKVTVFREGESLPIEINVIRQEIELKTVKYKELPGNIGYIRIIQFAENTTDEFKNAMSDLKSKGITKLVIDVRDNPGGLLDQVVDLTGQLLPKGLVVYTVDKKNKREDFVSDGKGTTLPFVVLINERSASASEILAGAVKDSGKASLIGAKTFGKGVVQSVFELGDGSGIKLTTSKYYTPKGISINKIGVKPDIEIQLENNNKAISKLTYDEDKQLQKAIEVLNK